MEVAITKYEVTIEETSTYKFETKADNEISAVLEAVRLNRQWKRCGEPDKLAFTVREA